jgi:predicted nucleic acid-binding protein
MIALVDTDVISELSRPRPNANVVAWLSGVDEIALSAITVDELFFGAALRPNPRVERWLDSVLGSVSTVLDVTAAIARHAGVLRGQLAARGRARDQGDMLIAATATIHGIALATRNVRDFDGCGITVVNPFA